MDWRFGEAPCDRAIFNRPFRRKMVETLAPDTRRVSALNPRGPSHSSRRHLPPVLVNHPLAILTEIFAPLGRQQIQHRLGGAAQAHAFGRDNHGAVDQDGVFFHRVQNGAFAHFRSSQAHLQKFRHVRSQQIPRGNAHAGQ